MSYLFVNCLSYFTVKLVISRVFTRDILNQNPNLFMTSLDVDSLFTNIPLDETINIIIEKLSFENETVHNVNKDQFKCLLTLATKEYRLLAAKSWSARGASRQPISMGSFLTICQTCLPCPRLVDGCGCSPRFSIGNKQTVKS